MSSSEIDAALARAHKLVENEKLDEARAILEPILAADKNNPDAWWIYAHAVATPEEGRDALQNVLRLAPNYPGAAQLMALAQEQVTPAEAPAKPPISPIGRTQPTPVAPPSLPETQLPEPDIEPEPDLVAAPQRQPSPPPSRGSLPIAPILAVLVIIILVVLVIASQSGGGTPPTPTQAAILVSPSQPIVAPVTAEVTEAEPTVTALIVQTTPAVSASEQAVPAQTATVAATTSVETTAAAASSAVSAADLAAVRGALSSVSIAQNGIVETQTTVGNTLLVSVCSTGGREMRTLLPQVMNALAKLSPSLDPSIQGVGTRMINCGQNTPLLTVAATIADAQSYAQGKLTDAQFAPLWKPQQ